MGIGVDEAIDEKFRSLDDDLNKIMLAFERGEAVGAVDAAKDDDRNG